MVEDRFIFIIVTSRHDSLTAVVAIRRLHDNMFTYFEVIIEKRIAIRS